MLCCESGEKGDGGLRTAKQVHLEHWGRAAWRPRCVNATAGIGPRVGNGRDVPSGMRRGGGGTATGADVGWTHG